MKIDNTPPPIPDWLDLGDVTEAKVGTKVTVLDIVDGKAVVKPNINVVLQDDGWRLLLARPGWIRSTAAIVKSRGGASPYFMSNRWFWYSANPYHVKLAEAKIKRIERREERKAEALAKGMAVATPIGDILGDGERYDSYGEPYGSNGIAQELAERLTVEQLNTLAGWLGLDSK